MTSSDYRRIAREKLQGNWGNAILAALIAALLGGLLTGSGLGLDAEVDSEIFYNLPHFLQQYIYFTAGVASALGLVTFIAGGVIRQGYCQYLLKQYDGQQPEIRDLFSQFHRFGDGFCLALLEGLYVFLWTLLLNSFGLL